MSIQPTPYVAAGGIAQLTMALFPLITDHLPRQEISVLGQTCRATHAGVAYARTKVNCIHLSSATTTSAQFALQLLGMARQYPGITNLKLNIQKICGNGIRALADYPLLNKISHLSLYVSNPSEYQWIVEKGDLSLLIQKINFVKLQVLDIGKAILPCIEIELLVDKLRICQQLKVLIFYLGNLNNISLVSEKLLKCLHGTLEELGPFLSDPWERNYSGITDEFVDICKETYTNPLIIRQCNLKIYRCSSAKLMELLQFLPLKTMSHISFSSAKGMSSECLDYLSSELEGNTNLVQLSLTGTPHGYPESSIQSLLHSINSPKLEVLLLLTHSIGSKSPTLRLETKAILRAKLTSFPKLHTLEFGDADLAELRAQPEVPHSKNS